MPKFTIDSELKSYITPLTLEQYAQLEANILADGCRDHLVAGRITNEDGSVILLDGHHRFEICQKNNIQYDVDIRNFQTRVDALVWMVDNQVGRRNLTPEQESYLRGLRYNQEKAKTTNPRGRNQYSEVDLQNEDQPPTRKMLAKKCGVAASTIERDGKFASAIDWLAENSGPELRQDILTRRTGLTRKDVLFLAKELSPEEQKSLLARDKKEIKEAIKELKAKNNPRPKAEHDEQTEPADPKPNVVVQEDHVDQGIDSTPESGPQIEDVDQVQVKTIGYANLDEALLMSPDVVATMLTTGGLQFVEDVIFHLKEWREKELKRERNISAFKDSLGETADQVSA